MEKKKVISNTHRRTSLTILSTSVITFILGKVFSPSINLFSKDYNISEEGFKNFRVFNTKDEMKLYDLFGNEVLIFEKEDATQQITI